jgi:integrase
MRIGELCGLVWDDIDFKEGTISINKTMNRYRKNDYGFTLALGSPKSQTSERTIMMNDVVRNALRTQRFQSISSDIMLPYLDASGRVTKQIQNFVFLNSKGNVWCEPTIREKIKAIVAAQNKDVQGTNKPALQEFCPHMVRHTFTSVAYSSGADVKVVSNILGHASTAVTLDRYTHLMEEKKREQEAVIKNIQIS